MGYCPVKVFTKTMPSGATLSDAIDLGTSYEHYLLELPSMASGGDVYLRGSDTIDGSYKRIYFNASSSTPTVAQIASSVSNAIIPLNLHLPQFVKIELSSATADTTYKFKIYGHN